MNKLLRINQNDNVVIALDDLKKGEVVDGIQIMEDIGAGHKIAAVDIKEGENVVKYGSPIGSAQKGVSKGHQIHVHNTKTNLGDLNDYKYDGCVVDDIITKIPDRDVKIYRRKNGDIGIRNELWIVPTVACVNKIGEIIIDEFKSEIEDLSDIDGINVYSHPYGCSQMGDDHENTKLALQDIAKHPNAGGVLVLGLGCENNQIGQFKQTLGNYDDERIKFLISQEVDDEIEEGVKILKELYNKMKTDKREPGKLSELRIGLECGGSDGFSGISANPLLGELSDYLIYHGGTTVLTEVPEMFGAEHILMSRAKNEEVFHKIVKMINDFKMYYKNHGQTIYENPSPGNKKGGITTLEDKALGCTQKAGNSKVTDVLEYGEIIKEKGLNLLTAPGNDLVATTALGMSGCQIVLFTTGRGTPYGGFVPTMKISTNSALANKKPRWIDFNAGRLMEGVPMDELLIEFVDYLVDVVNGTMVNNEKNNAKEIAIFKSGVIL
ncbi:D-altronate dehydratase [Natranaerovirga hydrolytica]|uniref:D-altronate dehydratase n=1 Tax=Natranaerovirga hydrolytica TaxID=680378 RepID=A0A4R1M9C6_9FIRM|nr:altronate dehydratase family protein [Natranaerovirga hydrolytica]TCK87980.1 D-altronate dehydratase [Natranaerovirga hydrolytica]